MVEGSTPGHDVAAVIAVYNGAGLVRRAIESVLRQTSPVRELVVVDDGSVDETGAIVRSYGDRVTYVRQDNRGVAAARNAGIEHASSTWIAFLDHDDDWLPDKIERQIACIRAHPDAVLCYSAFYWHGLDGSSRKAHMPVRVARKAMRLHNPFPPTVMMARRDALLAVGGFDEKLRGASCEDWDLNVRLLTRFSAVDLDEPLANYYDALSSNSVRHYELMLANTLAMIDPTLLGGLGGISRVLWRYRIQSTLYHRAAISARQLDRPAMALLLKSIVRWPAPDSRLKMLALEAGRAIARR